MKYPEYTAHCQVCDYIRAVYPNTLFCSSIAGSVKMSKKQWAQAKKSGYRKGFPDLFIYKPSGKYHGLAIEMKAGTNKATKYQENILKALEENGYATAVANGFDEAKLIIDKYFNGG